MTDLFQFVAARQTMDRETTILVRTDPDQPATQRLVERIVDGLDAPRYDLGPDDIDVDETILDAELGATMVVQLASGSNEGAMAFLREVEEAVSYRSRALTWIWVTDDPPERSRDYADIEVRPRLVGEVYRLQRDDYGDSLYMLSMEPVTVGGEPDG